MSNEPTEEQITKFKQLCKWYHDECSIPLVPLEFLRGRKKP